MAKVAHDMHIARCCCQACSHALERHGWGIAIKLFGEAEGSCIMHHASCICPTKHSIHPARRTTTTSDHRRATTNEQRRATSDDQRRATSDDERRATSDDERRATSDDLPHHTFHSSSSDERVHSNIGTIQRRLAWPLRKDDTHQPISVNLFFVYKNREV